MTDDPRSLRSLYRRLIWFRRGSDALRFGDYAAVDGLPGPVYAFTRTSGADRTLTLLNFADAEVSFTLPPDLRIGDTIVGTHGEPATATKRRAIANTPNEAKCDLFKAGAT